MSIGGTPLQWRSFMGTGDGPPISPALYRVDEAAEALRSSRSSICEPRE